MSLILLTSLSLCGIAHDSARSTAAHAYVRVDEKTRIPGHADASTPVNAPIASTGGVCARDVIVFHGKAFVGGGAFAPLAFATPANLDGAGRHVFFSQILNSQRNQGVFTADADGAVQAIAVGCGNGGGSGVHGGGLGDPTPIGGTFSGFFGGTVFAPATNVGGDVLFLADVVGGASSRALFLYRRAISTIVKIAAVGDASPAGGTLGAVGPGSVGDGGDVVFLALGATTADQQILRWSGGMLTKVMASGDPAPGGGVIQQVGGEHFGFADGTTIPAGPLPDISATGTIAFRALASGTVSRGIVVVIGGVAQWYVVAGDPTPAGGTYFDMQAANVNAHDEIAFFADWKPTATTFSAGWFAGKPGSWRSVLSFGDAIDGGVCNGLAFSRNPMQALADDGSVCVWTDVDLGASTRETIAVFDPHGRVTVAARQGEPTPLGGTLGTLDAWPSHDAAGRVSIGASTPGSGVLNARFEHGLCPPAPTTYCTAKVNSLGCSPQMHASGVSSASASSGFTVGATSLLNNKTAILIYGVDGQAATPFAGGLLCVSPPLKRTPMQDSAGNPPPNDCSGSVAVDMNAFAAGAIGGSPAPALSIPGTTVDCQVWSRDPGFGPPNNVSLSNGLEFVVGL